MKDYYKILGVPRNATASAIKQAYRKLINLRFTSSGFATFSPSNAEKECHACRTTK